MREKITRQVPQDDSAGRALNALQSEKKLTDAERYKARGVKSKEELMELARASAAKIRARSLELQEQERREAEEKRDAYLANFKNPEELVAKAKVAKVEEKKVGSLDVLDSISETIDEKKEEINKKILEEKRGRPMTPSSFDRKEMKLAEKNKANEIPQQEKKEKVSATPENLAYSAKAKQNLEKIIAKRKAENNKTTEEKVEKVTATPPKAKSDDVLSYEDYGVPLQGAKKETKNQKEVSEKPLNTEVKENAPKIESVLEQKKNEMMRASHSLEKFCAKHGIKSEINQDTFEIENYEYLLQFGSKKLTSEQEDEFFELLRTAVISRNRYLSEGDRQKRRERIDSEAKTVEVPQYITEETLKVPEFDEEDLPLAEEVVEEASPTIEVPHYSKATQEIDMEQAKLEFIEHELKKRWVDLLRKRGVARRILINREGLEFDAPIPEKFTYTTEGLLPQNAREMMRLAREKGTKEQVAYLQEFLSDVAEYIDFIDEWEKTVGKGDTQEIAQETDTEDEVLESKTENTKVNETGRNKIRYELGDKKVWNIKQYSKSEFSSLSPEQLLPKMMVTQKQIIERFPWVEFHLDKKPGHEEIALDHYKISNWEAIRQSKNYQNNAGEDLENGKLGVKELLAKYEKMLASLEEMTKDNRVVTFEKNKEGVKKMIPTQGQSEIKQKNEKRVAIETILKNNPVGKELAELIKSEKIPFISNYLESKGDVGEAIQESIAYLETELKKKKKQGGLFEKVARFLKADQGYEQVKKALKQLLNWKKYL